MKTVEEISAARWDLMEMARRAEASGDVDTAVVAAAGCAAMSWVLSLESEGAAFFAGLVAQAESQVKAVPS